MFDIAQTLRYWGLRPSVTPLTTTPVLVCNEDPQRAILYFQASGTDVNLVMDRPAGIPVGTPQIVIASGTFFRFTWPEDGPMSTYSWIAWSPTGAGQVIVTELYWRPRTDQ